jgi:outer membrane protein OmpA-like peptidoglycan-associated protein
MKLINLTEEEKKQFENGVIQVNGQAMNRTALGIIDAYLKLYPSTTFAELKQAIPDSINPSGPRAPKTIFKPFTSRDFGVVQSWEEMKSEFEKAGLPLYDLFFTEEKELFKTSDGVVVAVNKKWESNDTETKQHDLENLTKHVLNYGIVVNKFEARTPFNRGTYSLDIIQPELFDKISGKVKYVEKEVVKEKTVEKKVIPWWVWLILLLALIPFILWFAGFFKSEPQVVEKIVTQTDTIEKEKIIIKVDTVYVQQIEEIESKFNAVQFKAGKFDIPEDAKFVLYDLAKILKQQGNVKLKIEGHTSKEGDASFNQKLSEQRAKAVVDFLVSKGVEQERLSFEGFGSNKPIDTENLDKNRRTEFIVEK